MFTKTLQDSYNDQINKELFSAYLYLSMSAFFQALNLPGCARWMRIQYTEENAHAMKLFDYLHERGGAAVLQAINQPTRKFSSPLDVFEQTLAHEREVTASIGRLFDLARKENDHAAEIALQWFVTEQVEEEKNAEEIVAQLKMVGDNKVALLMLDRQLGARTGG